MTPEAEAQAAEAPVLTPDTGAQTDSSAAAPVVSGETNEDVETEALAMGWKPRSEFKGPDDKFVDAAEYVERGKTIMPFLRKELAGAYKKIEGLEKAVKTSIQHISKAEQRAYVKARADLDAELAHYAAAGDAANAKAVTDEIVALEKDVIAKADDPETPPEMQAWMDENPWYGTDDEMSAACDVIGRKVFNEGITGKAQIAEVDKRMRAKFPHFFAKPENPNRKLPGAVEGGGQSPRARGGKTYADLPPEAKDMCRYYEANIKGFTRDKFLKNYDWS